MSSNYIHVKGAREHNLKNISLKIPRDKFIVVTGLSGSGKSSLAFDTIYAEGQRRYVESLSSYARQFLGQMEKPDVDSIEGLSPAISIEQKVTHKNPRSTVGTITEIYDYLRLLFARVGIPYCYNCGSKIEKQSSSRIIERILEFSSGTKLMLLAPVVKGRKGEYRELINNVKKDGHARMRIDGKIYHLANDKIPALEKNKKHSLEIVVDRFAIKKNIRNRLADSVELVLKLGDGLLIAVVDNKDILYSQKLSCTKCHIDFPELTPRMFSFNSPYGACPVCDGLGTKLEIDPDLIVPDKNISIEQGAIVAWGKSKGGYLFQILETLSEYYGFSLSVPFKDIPEKGKDIMFNGTGKERINFKYSSDRFSGSYFAPFEGIVNNLARRYKETKSEYMREELNRYMSNRECPECNGQRLKKEILAVFISNKNIIDITRMSIRESADFFANINLSKKQIKISEKIIKEINARLGFLKNVGLDYLTLDRSAGTLSGGESQRIRLATQIGSGLMGVLYILDEPSIGLHQRDNKRLLDTLKKLQKLGNTLIVIEHDESTMKSADYIIDLGPGAGAMGGYLVSVGTPKEVMGNKKSLTGQYLSGNANIENPEKRRKGNGKFLFLKGAREHNLKNINVKFPLGKFICITGVSGSGKSTLINDILYCKLASVLNRARLHSGKHDTIEGLEFLDKVISIDQSPIGRTPRSNPATYTGTFTPIRELFSDILLSEMRGYKPGRFSFNVPGGRCETCSGDGTIRIEMHFLPDIFIKCDDCKGKRFNRETLEVKYKNKNIAEVLDMTVKESMDFFKNIPKVKKKLKTLYDVGLGYIKLGQSATTLSGGEAQRIKLATELSKRSTGKTLYLLDEPTTGLHFDDIKKLLDVLSRFVDNGNTVIVIEHNLDVIKTSDHVIDLGPEGGDKGGEIVAEGTPDEIIKVKGSFTGNFLKECIGKV